MALLDNGIDVFEVSGGKIAAPTGGRYPKRCKIHNM